jgi:hypothetical protein
MTEVEFQEEGVHVLFQEAGRYNLVMELVLNRPHKIILAN